jgi:hypothetical protein
VKKIVFFLPFYFSLIYTYAQIADTTSLSQRKKIAYNKIIDTSYNHRGTVFFATIPVLNYTTDAIALNTILMNQNAPRIGRFNFMLGLGFEERWKRFALSVEADFGSQNHENAKYDLTSTMLATSINTKYYVVKKKDIGGLYPFLGITVLDQSVYLTDLTTTADINGLFTQSGAVNMSLATGFVNMGIGFDILDFTKDHSLYLNCKMGYRHNIGSSIDNKWYVNENIPLKGAPTERLNAVYIQFAVGISLNQKSSKQLRLMY